MHCIPAIVSEHDYDLFVILQDDNIARIKTYDPAEILTASFPQSHQARKIRNVVIMYATEKEVAKVIAMCEAGDLNNALKYLSRGWVFRPECGDNNDPYRHACELEGKDHA